MSSVIGEVHVPEPDRGRWQDQLKEGILRAGGVPDALAVAPKQLLTSIVIGFAIDETGEGGHPPADQPPPDEAAALASDYLASLPGDRFPHLVAVAEHTASDNADEHFELLLDIFVGGLAQRARA